MSALRVMHVINRVSPTGGAEVSLAQILPSLQHHGVQNHVVALREHPDPSGRERIEHTGVPVTVMHTANRLEAVRRLQSLIDEHRPSLVHATLFDASLAARLAAPSLGVPVVCSIVNEPYSRTTTAAYGARWKTLAYRSLDRWLARHRTTAFHAITEAASVAGQRQLRLAPQQITVIPRGRDREVLGHWSDERRRRARERLQLGRDAPVVLNVGRQERSKAQHLLVQAFASVVSQSPDATLLIAGRTGEASGDLMAAINAHGLNERVVVLGARDDVADLCVAADVFAFSSLSEGMGGSLLEAMALDLPIVAFDIPAVAEVVRGVARLVPPGDARRLGDAMLAVLEGDCSSRIQAARQRFEERYEIGRIAERTAAFYAGVA